MASRTLMLSPTFFTAMFVTFTQFAVGQDKPLSLTPEVQTAAWAKDWWMPRHEQKLKEKDSLEQVDLLWIGDSITHGWESAGKPVWEEYYSKRHPFNIGFSGIEPNSVVADCSWSNRWLNA